MTNQEFAQAKERFIELAMILLRQCQGDKSKIDESLWAELVNCSAKIDDYI